MSTYMNLSETSQKNVRTSKNLKKFKEVNLRNFFILSILSVFTIVSSFGAMFIPVKQSANAWDPITDIICHFSGKSDNDNETGQPMAVVLLEVKDTDKYQWEVYSKSSANFGLSDVDKGFLNGILNISKKGDSFGEVNEKIIGRPLDKFVVEDANSKKEESKEFNGGNRVNPYDRFGVAGLNFTTYFGEWKYVAVDVCSNEPEPIDTKAGELYQNRLAPQSTWSETSSSDDPRSQAVIKSPIIRWFYYSALNLAANLVFWLTKFVVAVALALVNLSFTDISSLVGFDTLVAGTNGAGDGIVSILFEGLFFPMVLLAIIVVATIMIWKGLARRKTREAFTAAGQAVVVFILAILFFGNITSVITVPTKVSVVAQAMIAESMNLGSSGGNGLCTNAKEDFVKKGSSTEDAKKSQNLLDDATERMSSSIGCQFWQTLLFQPWSQAQWGKDWTLLYANPNAEGQKDSFKIPKAKDDEVNYLDNKNASWVGDAAVPMGNKEFEHNWALFNISVQTNAHSPIGHDGQVSPITGDISNDWWRIVDATSNYQEIPYEKTDGGSLLGGTSKADTNKDPANVPDPNMKVTDVWNDWTGMSPWSRLGYVILSLVVAVVSVIAPLLFGLFSVVYSLGMEILLIFLPVVMLIGMVSEWGMRVLKDWGKLLLQLFLKRLVVGILLILSISFVSAAMNVMQTQGWIQGLFILVSITIVLIMSRRKIIDLLTNFSFTQSSMTQSSQRLSNITNNTAGVIGKTTVGAVSGANAARKNGGNILSGASIGARTGFENKSRRSAFMRSLSLSKAEAKGYHPEDGTVESICASCRNPIPKNSIAWRSPDGLNYCDECGNREKDRLGLRQISTAAISNNQRRTPGYNFKPDQSNSQARNLREKTDSIAESYAKEISSNKDKKGKPIELSKEDKEALEADLKENVKEALDNSKHDAKTGINQVNFDKLGILNDYFDSSSFEQALRDGEDVKADGILYAAVGKLIEDLQKDPEGVLKRIEEHRDQNPFPEDEDDS